MFGFGALNNDFDYDGDFDFTQPVARKAQNSAGQQAHRNSAPMNSKPIDSNPPDRDLHDRDLHDRDLHDSDPHDFWKHEPTRSMPRLGARRSKPAAKPVRSRPTRARNNARPSADRQNGDPTQQIPVIDADGVIILDETACRPFDAATGLGGMAPGRLRTNQRPSGGNSNPLLRRVGTMMLLLSLGVPVAMAMRGDQEGRLSFAASDAAAIAAAEAATSDSSVAVAVDADGQVETPLVTAAAETDAVVAVAPETAAPAETVALPAAQQVVEAPAPVCVKTYTVALGDGWLRIANAHGITMDELLASNNANVSSFLMVGATICVPANATDPTTTVQVTTPAVTTPAAAVYVPPFSLACAKTYVVVLGDGWLRIANKHGVEMKELLKANAASSSTFLLVGKKICVPANATTPTTPTTPTTVKVTVTTKKPRPAPTPTLNPPTRTYTPAEVEAIIREIWPDDLEEEALRIAKRESRLNPRAQNYCCYGLFQIYFNVHKKWLGEMGITSGEQLLDPTIAAQAGLKLYQRNGWGPWKL